MIKKTKIEVPTDQNKKCLGIAIFEIHLVSFQSNGDKNQITMTTLFMLRGYTFNK